MECGDGTQARQINCMADLQEPDSSCDANDKPDEEQECNLGPCDGVEWMTTEWTQVRQSKNRIHHQNEN